MDSKGRGHSGNRVFRLADFLVVLIFLSIAAFSINLFRLDLFQTLDSRNEKPVGTIIIKNNIVQRRMANRVLWDRLSQKSNVYMGDLIRVAEHSNVTLGVDDKHINLNENTLIRIQRSPGSGNDSLQIELSSGSLSLTTGTEGENITLNLMGRQVQVGPGTALKAEAGTDGVVVQVSEGSATMVEEGRIREFTEGTMFVQDAEGTEVMRLAAVVTQPAPNARYLKREPEPLPISFTWNRLNLEPEHTLRLDISGDRNFTRNIRTFEGLNTRAQAALDAGSWYWRLSLGSDVLSTGQFTVVEASGTSLISPVMNSLFRYQDSPPVLHFRWSEAEDALFYNLEVCSTPDFINPQIREQPTATSFIQTNMEQGTWYWRVQPVFSSVYEGSAAYSAASSFRLEQSFDSQVPSMELPEPEPPQVIAQVPEPEIIPEPPPPPPPPPLLSAPGSRLPAAGARIGIRELRTQQSITFRWAEVQGANAYIFTLYQQTARGRRQIPLQREPENRTSWTMTDLSVLDRGTFIWQVEAVSRRRNGTFERRGTIGENSFILDIPLPGPVTVEETGVFYGH
ncbi:MAG: FecR family protein [Treponema sp.]|jgi:hypothetical protein|nr:FecR family protein [Treponema sp.]